MLSLVGVPQGHHGGLSGHCGGPLWALWEATVDVRVLSLSLWEAAMVLWGAAVMHASGGVEGCYVGTVGSVGCYGKHTVLGVRALHLCPKFAAF